MNDNKVHTYTYMSDMWNTRYLLFIVILEKVKILQYSKTILILNNLNAVENYLNDSY